MFQQYFLKLLAHYLLFFQLCVLLVAGILPLSVAQTEGNVFIKNYSSKVYRAAIQNWAVVQDLRGIMYIANDRGVLEYDGKQWALIPNRNQSAARSLALDAKGRVYVGGSNEFGFLAPNRQGQMQYVSLSKNLPEDRKNFGDVWTTHITAEGIVFQTDQYLFIYIPDNQQFKIIHAFNNSFFFLTFFIQKQLYVLDQKYGLHQLQNGKLIPSLNGAVFKDKLVYALLPFEKNTFLVGTRQEGLFLFQPNAAKKEDVFTPFHTEADNYLKEKQIYTALTLPDGEIALCTRSGGVVMIDSQGKVKEIINQSKGLADNNVHAAFVSREGVLWLALDNGISQVDYFMPIRYWNESNGLEGTVKDICYYKGKLYVATSLGVFYQQNNRFNAIKGINTQTWSLLDFRPDANTQKLLVSSNQGIYQIEDAQAYPVYLTERTAALKLYASPSLPNMIYAGLKGGLLRLLYQGGNWTDGQVITPPKTEIYSIAEEAPNVLWLGTFIDGVMRITLNPNYPIAKVQAFGLKNGLPSTRGNQVYRINQKIYIGTQRGIYKHQKNKITPTQDLGKTLGARGYGVHSLSIDPRGNIWIANTSNQSQPIGVAYPDEEGYYHWKDMPLRSLPEFEEAVVYADTSRRVWIGGSEGLFRFLPDAPSLFERDFKVHIRKITLEGDSLIYGGAFYDEHDQQAFAHFKQTKATTNTFEYVENGVIEFQVAAPFFIRDEATQYRYKLVETPSNWIEHFLFGEITLPWTSWSKDTKRQYTNLSEGRYVFYVQARNLYGIESEITTFKFRITPPWYRSVMAYFIYFLLLIVLVWAGIKFYTAHLKRRQHQLEHIITQRTHEISQKNEILLQQQDEIIEQAENLKRANASVLKQSEELAHQNQEITASINYARRIQEAMLPRQEQIQAAFADSFIFYKPLDIVSGDFYWFAETPLEPRYVKNPRIKGTPSIFKDFAEGKKIIAAIDCTGHGVPGAFMSMIGDVYLNQIVLSEIITQPQLILKELDLAIKKGLKQKETANLDGMDIALCVIDPNLKTLSFAGAKNPLLYIQNGKMQHIKGDKIGIGGFVFDETQEKEFTRHVIKIDQPTWFYIFSDGLQDQFGGKKGKKFMIKNLKELLLAHYQKPMHEQENIIRETLKDWMQGYQQIDDILLIGVYLHPDSL